MSGSGITCDKSAGSPGRRGNFQFNFQTAAGCASAFSRRESPELCKLFRPRKRAQGMPGARCTRGLVCKIVQRNAHEHTGSAEAIRHSLRNGFTAYAVISSATNSSCHRHRRISDLVEPGWVRKDLRRLDTSNGCQDHTVLPYASAPFVLRAGRSLTRPEVRPAIPCAPDAAASTASRTPRIVTTRTPLFDEAG